TGNPLQGPPDIREPAEIRHLREFSRFLVPRTGLGKSELWYAVAAIVGGIVPALAVATAIMALTFYGWFLFACPIVHTSVWSGLLALELITVGFLLLAERQWRKG